MKNPSQKKRVIKYALIILLGLVLLLDLYLVFTGRWILPQQFHIGSLPIRFYGLCLAVAALTSYRVLLKRRAEYNISSEQVDAIVLTLLISGFVGARIYHVVSEWSYYASHLSQIVSVWKGGLSIFGVVIGGVIGLWVYLKFIADQKQVSWQKLSNILDWLVPGVAIGQAIGRFGNLFNYEVFGYPTGLPWSMYVPPQFRLAPYEAANYFHPLFLYESLASIIIAIILIRLSPKLKSGSLFFLWLFLYNIVRFFLESLRLDSVMISSFRFNQIVAATLALIGFVAFRYIYVSKNSSNN